jgi:hypothetical protein
MVSPARGGRLADAAPATITRARSLPAARRNSASRTGGSSQEQAERVGEESRRQQENARDEDHGPVGDRAGRVVTGGERGAQTVERTHALGADEGGPGDGRQHDEADRGPEADPAADPNEERDLDDRHREECKEQPHAVDPPHLPPRRIRWTWRTLDLT